MRLWLTHRQVCWQAERAEHVHRCVLLLKAAKNHRLKPNQRRPMMNFITCRRSSTRISVSFNINLFYINTPHSGRILCGWVSNVRTKTRTCWDQFWCKRCWKIQHESSVWASLSLTLQHCHLRIKARYTQDIEPDWLSLTPLMWTAEAVEPRLAHMMKFLLYLYPHATPHRCCYESSPSIYSKWEQGRWILMHPCWPPHKHCYFADHVAPLTYTWNI